MVFGFVSGRASQRWSEKGTLIAGLIMCVIGAGGLLATTTLHLPLAAVVLCLFTMVSGVAVTTPPTTSIALADYPDVAGTASSFLGVARFAFGGFAAPLVGLGGTSAIPLGTITVASAALAGAVYALTIRSRSASPGVPTPVAAARSASVPQARVQPNSSGSNRAGVR